jgi:hypothetical protein
MDEGWRAFARVLPCLCLLGASPGLMAAQLDHIIKYYHQLMLEGP